MGEANEKGAHANERGEGRRYKEKRGTHTTPREQLPLRVRQRRFRSLDIRPQASLSFADFGMESAACSKHGPTDRA